MREEAMKDPKILRAEAGHEEAMKEAEAEGLTAENESDIAELFMDDDDDHNGQDPTAGASSSDILGRSDGTKNTDIMEIKFESMSS